MHTPDALVLGGGGPLGIAWLRGMAAGLVDSGVELRDVEYFVGTSAGAVIAAHLAAGEVDPAPAGGGGEGEGGEGNSGGSGGAEMRASRGGAEPSRGQEPRGGAEPSRGPEPRGGAEPSRGPVSGAIRARAGAAAGALFRAGATAATPLTPLAFALGRPGGAALRAAALSAGPKPTRSLEGLRGPLDRLRSEFDGRLRVTAVDKRTGRRVVFGEPGAPAASVTDAVLASCAVPWLFKPVTIAGREYVDGGAWSPSNLDVVPVGRGAEVMALLPIAGGRARSRLLTTMRAGALAAAQAEAQVLRARGARVRVVQPDERAHAAIGRDYFDARREAGVMAAGLAQGRALATHHRL